MPSICPRRPATAEVIRLVALDGQTTVSLCIGSSRCGRRGGERFLHRDPAGQAEGELGAVDAVVAAVDQGHGDVDDLEAQRPFVHRLADAFLDRRDPLLRHGAAVDLLLELEAFAAADRTDFDDDVAELAVPARLLLVAAVLADRLADRIRDSRSPARGSSPRRRSGASGGR